MGTGWFGVILEYEGLVRGSAPLEATVTVQLAVLRTA